MDEGGIKQQEAEESDTMRSYISCTLHETYFKLSIFLILMKCDPLMGVCFMWAEAHNVTIFKRSLQGVLWEELTTDWSRPSNCPSVCPHV